jgi:hypothetical protein
MSTVAERPPRTREPRQRFHQALPQGALACRDCGIPVVRPSAVVRVPVSAHERVLPGGATRTEPAAISVELTRCDRCERRRERARSILEDLPRLRRSLGSNEYAIDFIDAAMSVLDVLGLKPREIDRMVENEEAVKLLIHDRRMPSLGAFATWSARITPTMRGGILPDSCVPSRWGHLSDSDLQPLRDEYGALLMRHVATVEPLPVPADGGLRGCLLCGVGTVDGYAHNAADLWGPVRSANPGTLGGQNRPDKVRGHLCPICRPVVETVGAMGATALERAFVASLGASLRDDMWLRGLRAWCALPEGAAPNLTPWLHIRDREGYRKMLNDPNFVPSRTRLG